MKSLKNSLTNPLLWMSLSLILALGCNRYYKPVAADATTPEAKENLIVNSYGNKIMILRQGRYSYVIDTFSVDYEAMTMSATLVKLNPSLHQFVDAKPPNYRYTDTIVLKEMHIYTRDTSALDITKLYTIPFDQIDKIELIEHDKGRTTTSYITGSILTVVGIAIVVGGFIALDAATSAPTSFSCPYIGTYNGEQYMLQGELFAGAIKRNLERQDYMPLQILPVNGEFHLRISNELKEVQHTNYLDLIVLQHGIDQQAGIGIDGKPYLLGDHVLPVEATLSDGRDVLLTVMRRDSLSSSFDDTLHTCGGTDLTLTFSPGHKALNARLVLNLKTTKWLEYLYNEFAAGFAGRYDQWQKKLDKQTAEELNQWLEEQQILLSISVSTTTGWKEVTKLNTIGPLMNREVIVPIEFDKGSDHPIRIKLSTGFLFWEVDYAALDFTDDEPVVTTTLKPYSAIDGKGNDVLTKLVADDALYLTQPETGNYTILKYKFDQAPVPGKSYSVVLSASGYYTPTRHYEGKADLSFIRKFKKPGAMNTFSKERYEKIFAAPSAIALKQN